MDRSAFGRKHIVKAGQLRSYLGAQLPFKAQILHDRLGQLRRARRVSVKMSHALLVHRQAQGLAQVVEEHRPSQFPPRRDKADAARRVLPDVKAVVRIALVKTHAGQNLRDHRAEHLRKREQHLRNVFAAQQLVELGIHPLGRDGPEPCTLFARGARRLLLHGKAQHRGKAQQPQHAQRVFLKTNARVPHAAQRFFCQVLPSAEGVDQRAVLRHGHGVDRKVPPRKVVLDPAGEGDLLGMAIVAIGPVTPHGCDLDGMALADDGHRAVL